MKPIIVSPHAFERIHERQITRVEIEMALHEPDLKGFAKRGRLKVTKKFGARILNVFYRETSASIIFVTAYWSRL